MMVLNSKITPSGLEAVVDCLFTWGPQWKSERAIHIHLQNKHRL
jgi:hypothetical protein